MQTIIVGVDGSEASLEAVDVAAALVRELPDAQLVAVHASFTPYFFPQEADGDLDVYGIEVHARDVNDRVTARLADTGTAWLFERRDGEPAKELADVAGKLGARMIVVGRSGMGSMREVMVGSVSNRLVHHTDRPVLLV